MKSVTTGAIKETTRLGDGDELPSIGDYYSALWRGVDPQRAGAALGWGNVAFQNSAKKREGGGVRVRQ